MMSRIYKADRRGMYCCHGIRLGPFLMIHWHTGFLPETVSRQRWTRLRGVCLFRWRLPLKYYVD